MTTKRKWLAVAMIATIGAVVAIALMLVPNILTQAHDVALIKKTITIEMNDFSYSVDGVQNAPVNLTVGETVTLDFINKGRVVHDAHFGTDPDLQERLYKNNIVAPFDMLVLDSNERAKVTFTPTQAGTFELGCLQPGHYEAGMKIPFVIQ